jgi:hypothetical protein
MAGVVDVFAGASKVDKFTRAEQLWAGFKLGLDPVFDRLYVVVGYFLNGFDGFTIGFGKVLHQSQ